MKLEKALSPHYTRHWLMIWAIVVMVAMTMLYHHDSNTDGKISRQLQWFWLQDMPPLTPSLRIVFYAGMHAYAFNLKVRDKGDRVIGLLVIAMTSSYPRPPFGDSPLQAPLLWNFTIREVGDMFIACSFCPIMICII
jgi:hypothetical protein